MSEREGGQGGRGLQVVVTIAVLGLLLVVVVGGAWLMFGKLPESLLDADLAELTRPKGRTGASFEALIRPSARDERYVGSQACAECHQEIYDRYQTHPMSRATVATSEARELEDWQHTSWEQEPGVRYEIRRDQGSGKVEHAEVRYDQEGTIWEQSEQIGYVLGSGRRGRSYVVDHEGILFLSPVNWYSGENGHWGLAPGYSVDGPRFSKRLEDSCLYCHAGRTRSDEPGTGRYLQPVFVEAGIGCERCHGPGEAHVEAQRVGLVSDGKDPIIQPAKLDPERREAVCNQCHLAAERMVPRYGRTHLDFRPGDLIEDIWVVFEESRKEEGVLQAVRQVDQMRASKCFTASEGRMGCISCHDPHEAAPEEPELRVSYYDLRCQKCHDERGCSLPEAERTPAPANGSCTHCHMPKLGVEGVPHTSLTDHWVQRRPVAGGGEPALPLSLDKAPLLDHAEQRLPRREIDRARGLALMSHPDVRRGGMAAIAEGMLATREDGQGGRVRLSLDEIGDDVAVLMALARNLGLQRRPEEAIECWEQVLKHEPRSEAALFALLRHYHEQGRNEVALELADKFLAVNPYDAEVYGRRAQLLGRAGRIPEALYAAKLGLRLDPTMMQLQEWLGPTLQLIGRPEDAETQNRLVLRMQALERRRSQPEGAPPRAQPPTTGTP